MDWEVYRELGVGASFEDKPGREQHGGSGWHWHRIHKPGTLYQGGARYPPVSSHQQQQLHDCGGIITTSGTRQTGGEPLELPVTVLERRACEAGADPRKIAQAMSSDYPQQQLLALLDVALINQARRSADLARYPPPPEMQRGSGVPAGVVTHHTKWCCAEFAETCRDYWVYVPRQLMPGTAAKLVICQDGESYLGDSSELSVVAVLDSMIASGELLPTVALFVQPGVPWPDSQRSESKGLCPKGDISPSDWQRSFEYDSITDKYGGMLIKELIPLVERQHDIVISRDPKDRLITGHSSGGVASFVAGFHHPQAFGCVVSHCASYVNIRGAHQLPWIVRNTFKKDIKVCLLIGSNDNDNDHGNNKLGNQQLQAALEYGRWSSSTI
jgi:enterochelin esterase-like enzyme